MRLPAFAAFILALSVPVAAMPPARSTTPRPAARPAADAAARVTDTDKVCMVNDRYMGTPQIPVDVAGKRYYGCCAMCKERLAKDKAARYAVDPVSGKQVDKATAVIGQLADGSVLYFENEANRKKYRAR
jgi:YHS domain-containing protein